MKTITVEQIKTERHKMNIAVPQIQDTVDASYTATVSFAEAVEVGARELGAEKVGKYYYYRAEEVDEVFRLTAHEVASYGAGKLDERGVDYSLWCSVTGLRIRRPSKAVKSALGIEDSDCGD